MILLYCGVLSLTWESWEISGTLSEVMTDDAPRRPCMKLALAQLPQPIIHGVRPYHTAEQFYIKFSR